MKGVTRISILYTRGGEVNLDLSWGSEPQHVGVLEHHRLGRFVKGLIALDAKLVEKFRRR